MENTRGFEQEEGCSLGEKECCVAECYLLIEDSKNTVYLKLFSLMIFPGFVFFFSPEDTILWCCLTREKLFWREYKVIQSGQNRQTGVGGEQLFSLAVLGEMDVCH